MKELLKVPINWLLGRVGYQMRRIPAEHFPPDFDRSDIDDVLAVQAFTMTSPERIVALIRALEYLVNNRVPGDIVECGVWKGGSMLAVARTLLRLQDKERHLWLFDTFDGMSEPKDVDVSYLDEPARDLLCSVDIQNLFRVPVHAVKSLLLTVGYAEDKMHFIQGRVEETLPSHAPATIALLRLDTDWYESTMHELVHLFPRLVPRGVIIIDDYGHWRGARKATDEYIERNRIPILLNRIDYSGRMGIKAWPEDWTAR